MDRITPEKSASPRVLELRWQICAAAKQWEAGLEIAATLISLVPEAPSGWLHRSYCLHELKRTLEARDNLLRVVDKYPKNQIMRYNLACYECQLGHLKTAREWLSKAMVMSKSSRIKLMALDDPDLAPLWPEISGISSEDPKA